MKTSNHQKSVIYHSTAYGIKTRLLKREAARRFECFFYYCQMNKQKNARYTLLPG